MTDVDKKDLRKWRSNSPRIIALLCIAPLAVRLGLLAFDEKLVWSILVPAFGLVVLYFYEALDLRGPLWKEEMNEHVGKQIKDKLIELIPPELTLTEQERQHLRDKEIMKRITGVFWEAIDADSQLAGHKEAFYNNGKFYSTAFDLVIICGPLGFLYLIGLNFDISVFYVVMSVTLLSVALFAWYCLIPKLRAKHLELSAEQLDQLKRKQGAFVRENFERLITEMRKHGIAEP